MSDFACSITKGGLEIKCSVSIRWDYGDKFMVLKQFIVNNYTFERSLEDHSVTILKEIFEGLELEDTDKEAEEEFDAINDDNNDNVILMIDEHEDDDGDHEEELT